MKRLVILGAAGAGKSTQANVLADLLQVPVISTGEILRSAIATGSELGEKARHYVESGELVPDAITIDYIRSHLGQADVSSGWVLEGYPRTAFQAEELDFLLEDLKLPLDMAIYLDVPVEILTERSLLRGNTDDTPELIQRRIDLFNERTTPLLDYYEYKQKLLKVDGSADIATVAANVRHSVTH